MAPARDPSLGRQLPSRRELLRSGLLGGVSLGLLGSLAGPLLAGPDDRPEASGDAASPPTALILLWLQGGPSQLDTFDPKPGHPNGGGVRTVKTRTPGLLFAESLAGLAERSDRLCVVRSLSSTEGDHRRATRFVTTGHKPRPRLSRPGLASVAAYGATAERGPLPAVVRIGRRGVALDAGFLDPELTPFEVAEAGTEVPDLVPARPLTPARQARRSALLAGLSRDFRRIRGASDLDRRETAFARVDAMRGRPELRAFQLGEESTATRERYGPSAFGRGCLLARRLVERGTRCVEVIQSGWDTHDDNARRTAGLARQLDRGFSALLDDLAASGRLASTIILCLGEFGRTPVLNSRGGRDHYPRAFSAVLAGGGVAAGTVHGATGPDGLEVTRDRLTVPELHATALALAGVDPSREVLVGDRPVKLSEGTVRRSLLTKP